MMRVKMVLMEKNTRGGDNDGVVCSGGDDIVEDGEVIVRIVIGMVVGDIAGVERVGRRLRVVVGLGGDGVGIVCGRIYWWWLFWSWSLKEKKKD